MNLHAHLAPIEEIETTTVTQPLKNSKWHQAMSEEFIALVKKNGTWKLIPQSPNFNFVGCKWIF